MGLGSNMRFARRVDAAGLGASVVSLLLLSGCDGLREMDPPKVIQLSCAASSPPGASLILSLDTGNDTARWLNTAPSRTGTLTVREAAYVVDFSRSGWTAEVNRYDGRMVRVSGPAGPRRTRETLQCKPETKGPRF